MEIIPAKTKTTLLLSKETLREVNIIKANGSFATIEDVIKMLIEKFYKQ